MRTNTRMITKTTQAWLLAIALAFTLAAGHLLDGPSDIEVMQLVAAEKTALESGK